MLQWRGQTPSPLTFDLGKEFKVASIEMACEFLRHTHTIHVLYMYVCVYVCAGVPGTSPLRRFQLELTTQWISQPLQPILSPWPTRQDLQLPVVASHLQLCPTKPGFKAQLQLYGNTHGMCECHHVISGLTPCALREAGGCRGTRHSHSALCQLH